jgi:uncharacterized protein YbjT (DUF2867 family)
MSDFILEETRRKVWDALRAAGMTIGTDRSTWELVDLLAAERDAARARLAVATELLVRVERIPVGYVLRDDVRTFLADAQKEKQP